MTLLLLFVLATVLMSQQQFADGRHDVYVGDELLPMPERRTECNVTSNAVAGRSLRRESEPA